MAFKPVNGFVQIELIKPTPKKGEEVNENMREEFATVIAVAGDSDIQPKVGQKVYFKLYNVFKFTEGKNEYNLIKDENILAIK